jgi:hypothetical protein
MKEKHSMSKPLFRCVLAVVGVVVCAQVARAEDRDPDMQGPPTKDPERTGATVTLAFGPGELHVVPDDGPESRSEGAAFSLRVGTALSQKSAFEALIDYVHGSGQQSVVFGGSIKLYVAPTVYVRPGGGLGMISMSDGMGGTDRHWGPSVLMGVGYEWFQLRDIALFGEFEMMANRLAEENANTTIVNAQVNFGITWY